MRRLMSWLLCLSVALACSKADVDPPAAAFTVEEVQAEVEEHQPVHWDYDEAGPDEWGSLSPDYSLCDQGSEQSPIDLTSGTISEKGEVAVERSFEPVQIVVSHLDSTVRLLDTGHTIQVSFEEGNSISVGEHVFGLAQFHFHAPSEHTVDGRQFPMEAHFVHSTASGELAVFGVLVEEGEHNADFAVVWNQLPLEAGQSRAIEGVDLDLDSLVPRGSSVYRYRGSLTTPPCSEGVEWYVRTDPISMSDTQIATFTGLIDNNNRPVQALNGRQLSIETPTYSE